MHGVAQPRDPGLADLLDAVGAAPRARRGGCQPALRVQRGGRRAARMPRAGSRASRWTAGRTASTSAARCSRGSRSGSAADDRVCSRSARARRPVGRRHGAARRRRSTIVAATWRASSGSCASEPTRIGDRPASRPPPRASRRPPSCFATARWSPSRPIRSTASACRRADPIALERLFALKDGRRTGGSRLLVADLAQATRAGWRVDERARALAARFWPGALTLVARRGVAPKEARSAFRAPDHPVALELIRRRRAAVRDERQPRTSRTRWAPTTCSSPSRRAQDDLAAVVEGGAVPGGVASRCST